MKILRWANHPHPAALTPRDNPSSFKMPASPSAGKCHQKRGCHVVVRAQMQDARMLAEEFNGDLDKLVPGGVYRKAGL